MKNISELGRSMIEMLGVLAIIGVLTIGGVAGYSKAMEKYKINKAIEIITSTVSNIRTAFTNQGNYNGLSSDLEDLNIIPEEMWRISGANNREIDFPFSTYAWIDEEHISDKTKMFTIDMIGLSKEICIALASQNWGNYESGFVGIMVNSNMYTTETYYVLSCKYNTSEIDIENQTGFVVACSKNYETTAPLSISNAALGCAKCEEDDNEHDCEIVLGFK